MVRAVVRHQAVVQADPGCPHCEGRGWVRVEGRAWAEVCGACAVVSMQGQAVPAEGRRRASSVRYADRVSGGSR